MRQATALKSALSLLSLLREAGAALPESIQAAVADVAQQQGELLSLLPRLEESPNLSDEEKRMIINVARQEHHVAGECEIDEGALISCGSDDIGNLGGAYVQAWIWVDLPLADQSLSRGVAP